MKKGLAIREVRVYDEPFKRKVIEEYLSGGCTKKSLIDKYHIYSKGAMQTWMRQLGYSEKGRESGNITAINNFLLGQGDKPAVPVPDDSKEALSKRIKELEQRLGDEQLLREMYEKMIKSAEEQFKIDIRKKRNTR
jgi:transposase-like protein